MQIKKSNCLLRATFGPVVAMEKKQTYLKNHSFKCHPQHIEHKSQLRSLLKFCLQTTACTMQWPPSENIQSYLRCSFLNCSFIISGLSKFVLNETSTSLFPATSFCEMVQDRKVLKVLSTQCILEFWRTRIHSDTVHFFASQEDWNPDDKHCLQV